MQTFLPYYSFRASAEALDSKRLGKQRVETKQILNALAKRKRGESGGWVNHPAVIMWEGFEDALKEYGNYMIEEWVRRGYNNNMPKWKVDKSIRYPEWLGDPKFHASHRSNLLRKDWDFYSRYDWTEPVDLEYVWPRNF